MFGPCACARSGSCSARPGPLIRQPIDFCTSARCSPALTDALFHTQAGRPSVWGGRGGTASPFLPPWWQIQASLGQASYCSAVFWGAVTWCRVGVWGKSCRGTALCPYYFKFIIKSLKWWVWGAKPWDMWHSLCPDQPRAACHQEGAGCAHCRQPPAVWLGAHVMPTERSRALWPPPHSLTYACTGLSCLQI